MTDRNNRNSLQDKHPFIKETIKEPPSDRKSVAKKLLLASVCGVLFGACAVATMVLFYAVGFWNQWLQPLIYLDDRKKFPMQLILRNIVLGADAALSKSMSAATDMATMGLNIKYAVIFVTILPILVIYPFVQKYFVKGVMVGSVKG